MRSALIAAAVSFALSLAISVYDCQTGTHEQCLMSQGLFWLYWILSFFLAWLVVASIRATIRFFKSSLTQR